MWINKLKTNSSGIVLITVLMTIIIMTVFTLSMMTLNLGQVMISQKEVDRIKAEQLTIGAWWLNHTRLTNGDAPIDITETLDGKVYDVNTDLISANTGPNNTDVYQLDVTY